ncbi:hypothetical protein [Georgenia wangjunii]|uniref:hypothetical protein n=1 Tax=Georgenia wangjunii TaxID=3117730 RepID=UPI002F260F08
MGRRVLWTLVGIATGIAVISGLLYVAVVLTGFESSPWHGLHVLVDVAGEHNAATWYASVLWALLALTAVAVGAHAPRLRLSWFFLAAVAVYASIDEYAMLHEKLWVLGDLLTEYLPFDPFSYRWVVAGVVLAVVVAALLAPLALRLPLPVMVGLVAAGFVFLLGAVGVETWGGFVERSYEQLTWHLKLLMHLEEWLEMVGVALAIWSVSEMIVWRRTEDGVATAFRGYRGAPGGA